MIAAIHAVAVVVIHVAVVTANHVVIAIHVVIACRSGYGSSLVTEAVPSVYGSRLVTKDVVVFLLLFSSLLFV